MAEIMRVSIFGGLPGGEEWSVNPVYSIGGDFGVPVSAAQALAIATAAAAIAVPSGLTALMNGNTTVQGIRVEARSLAGVLETQAEVLKATATPGTGVVNHPYQTSLVLSLRTTLPGASGRGRLYWPSTGASLNSADLRLAATQHTNALAGAKTYLSGIETAIEASLTGVALGVWSRKLTDITLVNTIQVGNVLDVQRRRRDALLEGYVSVSYP